MGCRAALGTDADTGRGATFFAPDMYGMGAEPLCVSAGCLQA